MITVTVRTSKKYNVLIGSDNLKDIGSYILGIKNTCKIAVISDTNVWPLYGNIVTESLTGSGYTVLHHIFPAGEASKNITTYTDIVNFLAKNQLTRSDILLALGGGVVGDITGFAAATYLRGISYIQVPTTLLAIVDSSVGGKTAIDLPVGKNLIGAFCQPDLVLCDTSTLSSLPSEVFIDGCAEVIKYGVLFDRELFEHLENKGIDFDREYVISRCVALKRDIVETDEFDTGMRQLLNLGHTIGHAVEAHSQFTITHGQAVAIGMVIVTKVAYAEGLCSQETLAHLVALIKKFRLPEETNYTADDLLAHMLSDKKRFGNTLNLVMPVEIGNCRIIAKPVEQIRSIIELGL